jgi:hypothetical protein
VSPEEASDAFVFLGVTGMTNVDGRPKREATRQLDESLRRLKTERIVRAVMPA